MLCDAQSLQAGTVAKFRDFKVILSSEGWHNSRKVLWVTSSHSVWWISY